MAVRTIVACEICGFELWRPISALSNSYLGLYSDVRFPGRCILTLDEHFDHFDELSAETMYWFMLDVRNSIAAIKTATGAKRVNMAVLGNQEGHVHAHLIPRNPQLEPRPDKAPWEDTRARGPLEQEEELRLVNSIQQAIALITGIDSKFPLPARSGSLVRREIAAPDPSFRQPELFGLMSDSQWS